MKRRRKNLVFQAGLALLLSGCSSLRLPLAEHIDRQVVGWHKLSVTTRQLGFFELQGACWKHLPIEQSIFLPIAMACAVVNLEAGTCVINSFGEMSDEVREHEESHCRGGAHDNGFQELFDRFESRRKARELTKSAKTTGL